MRRTLLVWDMSQQPHRWVVDERPQSVPAGAAQRMAELFNATTAEAIYSALTSLGAGDVIARDMTLLLRTLRRYVLVAPSGCLEWGTGLLSNQMHSEGT